MILRGGTSIEHESNNDADKAVLERIRRINLAFVALGDDDENIEMSIHLRMLFDRLNEINNKQAKQMEWRKEPVEIFQLFMMSASRESFGMKNALRVIPAV